MMKNKDKICLAAFAVAAFMFMLAGVNSAEDSDAAPTKDYTGEKKIGDLYYILLTDTSGEYLEEGAKIAFLGNNRAYDAGESGVLEIPSTVTYKNDEGEDVTYTVVGIRNNSFKANGLHNEIDPKESNLRNLKEVIFPETIQVIGIKDTLEPATDYSGFSFSKCYNLKKIVFEGNPQLRHLAAGSFQDTSIESVDLSNCKKLIILNEDVFGSKDGVPTEVYAVPSEIEYADLRSITDIANNAFRGCKKISTIIMPAHGTIHSDAFPAEIKFYDDDGKEITKRDDLVGKAFKKVDAPEPEIKLMRAYVATFVFHGGDVLEGEYLEKVYFKDEKLPGADLIKKTGVEFYQWEYGREGVTAMPGNDIELHAVYTMELPESASITYDGNSHSLTFETDVEYEYIKGDKEKKDAGKYYTQIKPKDVHTLWKIGETVESSWSVDWTIEPTQLTEIKWTAPENLDPIYSGTEKIPKCTVGATEGVIGDDNVSIIVVLNSGDNINVGTFKFIATGLEGQDSKNYSLPGECLSPEYIISAKDLTIKADDQEVQVGDPAAPFTVTTVGFVGREDMRDLDGSLKFDCSYTTSSPAGSYAIVPSGVGSNNYCITFENGTLTAKGEQPDPPGPTPKPTPKPPVITVSVKIESSAGGHTSTDSLTVPLNSPVTVNGDKLIIGSGSSAAVVRAIAETGYEFDSWSIEDGRILENTDIYVTFKKVSLGGITVKTYPQKTVYNEGDKFDPTGLSIQLTYSDGSAVRVDYEGNESDFSFSPSLDTPLKASDDKVVVTFMGQSAVIKISVSGAEDNTMMFIIVGVIAVIALVAIAAYLLRRQPAH